MLIALALISFLLFIVALIVMPKRIYEQFEKKDFPGFWKWIALLLADLLLFGATFAAAIVEPGELVFGAALSLVMLLVFAACFSGAVLIEAFQKKASQKQKIVVGALATVFLISAVLLYLFFLR